MRVPENYVKLPDGVKCRCANLWSDGKNFYCCNPKAAGMQKRPQPELTTLFEDTVIDRMQRDREFCRELLKQLKAIQSPTEPPSC